MLRLFLFFLAACISTAAFAQTGKDARAQLSGTMDQIKAIGKRQKKIEEQRVSLEHELKDLKRETIDLAKEMSGQEQVLSGLEDKLGILEDQKKQKNDELDKRKAELSALIASMVRLRQMPPEAVIAMPGKLDETLAASRALNIITHAIEEDAQSLRQQLNALDNLEEKIRNDRATIVARKAELDAKRAVLEEKMAKRSKLEDELGEESQQEKERLAQLKTKSHNLQDLIDALGKAAAKAREDNIRENAIQREEDEAQGKMRSFADAKGKIQMPAAGKVIRHYGSEDASAFSRGITLETPQNATVVAPFDGEVVYAGNFRDYGHIVILRHSDHYHTLLSGMEHVNCRPGQVLQKGEPVGTMGSPQEQRHLYVEVRRNNKPVDPSPWLKGA